MAVNLRVTAVYQFHGFLWQDVRDFEAILAPLNEHLTDNLTYLSRHKPISVAIHDTLDKESVYLVDENSKHLIGRFIKVLTEKARSYSCRCIEATLISFRFSNASG